MRKKKKTAGIVASSGGQKYINNKLSVRHNNTLLRIGQEIFNSTTRIFSKTESQRRGQSRCHHCLNWFDSLAEFGIWKRPLLSAILYGLCKKCADVRKDLPPKQLQSFAERCERNIKKTLGVNADA